MLKNKTKIVAIILAIILLLSSTTVVFADEESQIQPRDVEATEIQPRDEDLSEDTDYGINLVSDEPSIPTQVDSYKKEDIFAINDNVTIDYIVDGNLFIMANTVTINSQIGGDAFIMAKEIIIDEQGYIFNNLFAIAQSITVKGVVYDIYALANTINVQNGYVYRDLKASCNDFIVNGQIGRDVFLKSGNISFNTIENSNGAIYGNLNYSSDSELDIPENVVTGTINYTPVEFSKISTAEIISDYILSLLTFIVLVLIIYALCLWIAPKFINNTNNYVGNTTWKVLGKGLLTLVLVPFACIILLLLRLTSSVSLILFALYILAIVISKTLFTIVANNFICSKFKIDKTASKFGILVISSIVVWAICKIPYIGGFINLICVIIGLGILVSTIFPAKKLENTSEKENN